MSQSGSRATPRDQTGTTPGRTTTRKQNFRHTKCSSCDKIFLSLSLSLSLPLSLSLSPKFYQCNGKWRHSSMGKNGGDLLDLKRQWRSVFQKRAKRGDRKKKFEGVLQCVLTTMVNGRKKQSVRDHVARLRLQSSSYGAQFSYPRTSWSKFLKSV